MTTTETAPERLDEASTDVGDVAVDRTDRVNGNGRGPEVSTLGPVADAPTDGLPTPRTSHVVLRRVQPWSVFKLSLLFYLCVCAALLVASIALWLGASAVGVIGNVESFFQDAGFDEFQFSPAAMLKAFTIGGFILVVAGTVANMLLATLFNLMSDVVGGVRITLAEDLHTKR